MASAFPLARYKRAVFRREATAKIMFVGRPSGEICSKSGFHKLSHQHDDGFVSVASRRIRKDNLFGFGVPSGAQLSFRRPPKWQGRRIIPVISSSISLTVGGDLTFLKDISEIIGNTQSLSIRSCNSPCCHTIKL